MSVSTFIIAVIIYWDIKIQISTNECPNVYLVQVQGDENLGGLEVRLMMFNTTFNNISVIS